MLWRTEIPENYNKIAEFSDNYIVWVRENKLYNDRQYEAYIQYIKPYYYIIKVNNYTIKNGTNLKMIPNYNNNGMYSYIEDYDITYELTTQELQSGENFTNKIDYVPEYNEISISIFILLVSILWVFNQISKLWCKGGCFK